MLESATKFTITTKYRDSRLSFVFERMPLENLWAAQSRIDGELLAHTRLDGSVWDNVPILLDEAIADIDSREDDGDPDGGSASLQAA